MAGLGEELIVCLELHLFYPYRNFTPHNL